MGIWPTTAEDRARWQRYVDKYFPRPARSRLYLAVAAALAVFPLHG